MCYVEKFTDIHNIKNPNKHRTHSITSAWIFAPETKSNWTIGPKTRHKIHQKPQNNPKFTENQTTTNRFRKNQQTAKPTALSDDRRTTEPHRLFQQFRRPRDKLSIKRIHNQITSKNMNLQILPAQIRTKFRSEPAEYLKTGRSLRVGRPWRGFGCVWPQREKCVLGVSFWGGTGGGTPRAAPAPRRERGDN